MAFYLPYTKKVKVRREPSVLKLGQAAVNDNSVTAALTVSIKSATLTVQ